VLAPLVALIVGLALYPQLALHKSEDSVKASIHDAKALTQPAREASR
jgi:hypothetical protein